MIILGALTFSTGSGHNSYFAVPLTFTTRQRPMIPLRAARSTGILGRGLRCHRAGSSEKRLKALKPHQVLHPIPINTTTATGTRRAAAGVSIQRPKQCWDGERRLPTAVGAATYLNNRRHSSGHSGIPGDKRWQSKEKGDKQEPYTFLDREDHERLTGKSSERDLANSKSADEAGEEVDFKDMTMWQRVKYVRSRAKLMWKRYGLVAIGTSVALYVGGFGILYTLLASGAVDPNVDISEVVQQVSDLTGANKNEKLSEYVERVQHLVRTNKQYEHIFLSFIVNEALELPRDVIVLFVTPPIARALGRAPPIDAGKKR